MSERTYYVEVCIRGEWVTIAESNSWSLALAAASQLRREDPEAITGCRAIEARAGRLERLRRWFR